MKPEIKVRKRRDGSVVCSFSGILPINRVEQGIMEGHYTDRDRNISNETVRIKPARGRKTLFVVCPGRTVKEEEYAILLPNHRKQPMADAANYFFSLMAQVPEEQMPPVLDDMNIVAAEPNNPSAVFTNEHGPKCPLLLCAVRYKKNCHAHRELRKVCVSGKWGGNRWGFLAENRPPKKQKKVTQKLSRKG